MGQSNRIIVPIQNKLLEKLIAGKQLNTIACLGSTEFDINRMVIEPNKPPQIFCYDIREEGDITQNGHILEKWQINSQWNLGKTFDLIISTACPFFCKKPLDFIERCYYHLNPGGLLFVDWGYGDHFKIFADYKIGWKKNGEHEWCYWPDNYGWSGIWDDSFVKHPDFVQFCDDVQNYGYKDVKQAIFEETPSIITCEDIKKYFDISVDMLSFIAKKPMLIIFISGIKKAVTQ